jgi:hypothetical protein
VWPSNEREKHPQKNADLEQRLTAYYGPRLGEQPLTDDSWQQLRRKLVQRPSGMRIRLRWPTLPGRRRHRFSASSLPAYIHASFTRIAQASRTSTMPYMLNCTVRRKLRTPIVQVSPLSRRPIRVTLPVDAEHLPGPAALDVLLATGLARYQLIKKTLLHRLLLIGCICLVAYATIFFAMHTRLWLIIPIAIIEGASLALLLDRRKRGICYEADTVVVLWLGRERVCEGLHMLADRTRFPRRRRWGELSLTERINRVCGTRVESRDERLTLSR